MMEKIRSKIKYIPEFVGKWKWMALMALLCSLLLNFAASAAHYSLLQRGIAESVLRFHVLANSDSEADQNVKYMVRDEVLDWLSEQIGECGKEEEQQFLLGHLTEIEQVADRVLEQQGFSYRSEVKLEDCYFPERTYGDCTFPAGWYEALRICLGEAKGQNWWCVLYPRLCFSDCLHAVVEEEQLQELEEVLTVEEYESLLRDPKQWKFSFRWF